MRQRGTVLRHLGHHPGKVKAKPLSVQLSSEEIHRVGERELWQEIYMFAWALSAKRWPFEQCYWHDNGLPAIAGFRWGVLGFQVQVILADGETTRWVGECPVAPPERLRALASRLQDQRG